ncbi:MAG: metallophosphoesterase family protein [Desulfosalsimonas sp.]
METRFIDKGYRGIIAIGDPHLEGRVPGFRCDDYPAAVLEKLRWCLSYAREHALLPVILGDLFHLPRNNPNWLLVSVMELLGKDVPAIYGNHDVHENSLTPDDSIRILQESGHLRLLDESTTYPALISGTRVIIGGTPWGQRLPVSFDQTALAGQDPGNSLVIWLAHHDTIVPGYEDQGRIHVREIPGIDIVINGHIHRCLGEVVKGGTRWIVPGNISRRSRSEAARQHRPAVLRVDIDRTGEVSCAHVTVPHRPFDEVFFEALEDETPREQGSAFVAGLAELQARRTQTGEGLEAFLEKNLDMFEPDVASEIRKLAGEVMKNE